MSQTLTSQSSLVLRNGPTLLRNILGDKVCLGFAKEQLLQLGLGFMIAGNLVRNIT